MDLSKHAKRPVQGVLQHLKVCWDSIDWLYHEQHWWTGYTNLGSMITINWSYVNMISRQPKGLCKRPIHATKE